MAKFTPALTLVVCLASVSALRAQESMAKPLGKWERKIGKSHVTLIVESNRLHATFIGEKPCVLHADYSMTRDGVLFGVVTSIECEEDEDSIKTVFDAPFSCRFRIDEGALIIHDLKCHEVDSKDDVWNGRFKAVSPTPTQTVAAPPSYPMPIGAASYTSSSEAGPYNATYPMRYPTYSPTSASGSSNPALNAPTGTQEFQFWSGFIR
jgi:hypothetical protein